MKRNNRRKRTKGIKLIFFAIIFLYFIYKLVFGMLFQDPLTEIIQYGNIDSQKEYECIVIRQEFLIESPIEGSVKYFAKEGEKVEKDFKVAEIYSLNMSAEDRNKLVDINNRIVEIKDLEESIFHTDIEKLDNEILSLIDNIKKSRIKNRYSQISFLKNELNNKLDKKSRIKGGKSFSGINLENLETEKNILEEKINNSIVELYSPESGIISYYIDGVEEILNPENLSNIKIDFIKSLDIKPNSLQDENVIYNQPVFKVIDNTSWYIGILTDINDSETFKIGGNLIVEMNGDQVNGLVEEIIKSEDDSLIIVKIHQQANNFHKERRLKLNIIKDNYEGLKINKDSIIEKDGQLGVYSLDINNKSTFVPIKIVGYKEDEVIINDGFYYENVEKISERIKTISLFDEILRNAKKYKEGEIIY